MYRYFKTFKLTFITLLLPLTTQLQGDYGNFSPPYPPYAYEDVDFNVNLFGELLVGCPGLQGLDHTFGDTTITTSVDTDNVTTFVNEKDVEPNFKWNYGAKFGADLIFACYKLSCFWTHFSSISKFREESRHGTLPSTLTLGFNDYQHGDWRMHYDTANLILGRAWMISDVFLLKPYVGVRALWVNQNIKAHLQTLTISPSGQTLTYTDLSEKEAIWGLGPILGIETIWLFQYNLSLFGKVDFVQYYGTLRGKNKDLDTFTNTTLISLYGVKHDFNSLGLDWAVGFRWDRNFVCGTYDLKFQFKLAWEEQRINDFSNLGSDGTFSLGALSFGVGLEFTL
jgi:hypothetical protein